jgi:hypothetical protein
MALTQMQLIQSLGEALAWFEREIDWGVPPTELGHLCGRIGELYAALISNGRMADRVNQKGYDVVSGVGERISVKTTAVMGNGGLFTFNANTIQLVDRVIILRINTEDMQVEKLLDVPLSEALNLMYAEANGKRSLPFGRLIRKPPRQGEIPAVTVVSYQGYTIRELESGAIELERDGASILPAKPELRALALRLNIGLLNSNGNTLNTRQLGSRIIKSIQESDGASIGA